MEPLFEVISQQINFPVDQIRYTILLFLSYPLAYIFRYVLHPSHTSLTTRCIYSVSLGLAMGFMCFGWQMFILFGVVGVSYSFLLVLPPNIVQSYTMFCAMGFVSAAHIYRMITDYEGWHLDFTGPLMLIVQRITLTGYAYHDGTAREESSLNEDQKKQKINERPSLLVYFSYNFNFHSFLAGPTCGIKDYIAFMDGSNVIKQTTTARTVNQEKALYKEPSPFYPVLKKLLFALLSLTVYMGLNMYVVPRDTPYLYDHNLPALERYLFLDLEGTRGRYRFIFVWLLVDSINNLAGLGFNGYDESGNAKWDLVSLVRFPDVEYSLNMRAVFENWNITTNIWLRRTVYERVEFFPVLQTFVVSAVWHGFYPGYYCCFISQAVYILAARKMRHLVRPYFQGSTMLKRTYDFITILVTRVFVNFGLLPLFYLTLEKSLLMWSHFYYMPLVVSCVVVLVFPSGKKSPGSSKDGNIRKLTLSDTVRSMDRDKVKSE